MNYNDKNYDYKFYWKKRSYEHNCEVIALKKLLPKKGNSIIDIGAGFGRLFPVYESRFKEVILFEPSKKLLEQARDNINKSTIDKVFFRIGKIPIRDRPKLGLSLIEYDCVLMVRVAHHLEDLNSAIASVSKIIKKDGVFILEFANKIHFLNILKNSARLNFGFFSQKPYKVGTFILLHPAYVKEVLEK
ncbi:MAG: class I SAM-dependent methyltransferase, partial [Patescibacteria group bacterium]